MLFVNVVACRYARAYQAESQKNVCVPDGNRTRKLLIAGEML